MAPNGEGFRSERLDGGVQRSCVHVEYMCLLVVSSVCARGIRAALLRGRVFVREDDARRRGL